MCFDRSLKIMCIMIIDFKNQDLFNLPFILIDQHFRIC